MRLTATITAIKRETPTVKSFALDLGGREIGFSAGQWVDLFVSIEGAEAVGGYSITSSPADQSTIRLAVKHDGSDHPVTNWLHDDAREGDLVEVSLGGEFTYTPDEAPSVVLIGGGIGMTPLMSIVRAVDEMARLTCLTLVYSASSPDEILFIGSSSLRPAIPGSGVSLRSLGTSPERGTGALAGSTPICCARRASTPTRCSSSAARRR